MCVMLIYDWDHVIGENDIKKMNRQEIVMSGAKIHWWINWFGKGGFWLFSNPELKIDTEKLVTKLC